MSEFQKDLEKMHLEQNPDGTIVLPMQKADNHKPLSERQKKILIRDHYVILASGEISDNLRLYYEYPNGTIGTTKYPKLSVPKAVIEFKFTQIVRLRNYLGSLPFGGRLVENMERSVISVSTFNRAVADFRHNHKMR